jgi:hypothetical protein
MENENGMKFMEMKMKMENPFTKKISRPIYLGVRHPYGAHD